MAEYEVILARNASRELEALPPSIVARVFPRIEGLGRQPRLHGSRKLKGPRPLWRIRIGDYRVIYAIDDLKMVVDVSVIRHRSKAYE